jgi:hypothetical protein
MRYAELQAAGRDADQHNYLADWIPVWGRRVRELALEDIAIKRQRLKIQYRIGTTINTTALKCITYRYHTVAGKWRCYITVRGKEKYFRVHNKILPIICAKEIVICFK